MNVSIMLDVHTFLRNISVRELTSMCQVRDPLKLCLSVFTEVEVTIQTVKISHACLTSDNVNPKRSLSLHHSITSNHLFIMPRVQWDSPNTVGML